MKTVARRNESVFFYAKIYLPNSSKWSKMDAGATPTPYQNNDNTYATRIFEEVLWQL
jgi:hypothetical protein